MSWHRTLQVAPLFLWSAVALLALLQIQPMRPPLPSPRTQLKQSQLTHFPPGTFPSFAGNNLQHLPNNLGKGQASQLAETSFNYPPSSPRHHSPPHPPTPPHPPHPPPPHS